MTKALAIVVDCGGVYDRVKKSFVVYWFYSSFIITRPWMHGRTIIGVKTLIHSKCRIKPLIQCRIKPLIQCRIKPSTTINIQ